MGTGPRRLLVFTGDGKGKTTAALGMVLRACGHGQRALVLQFIKADDSTGEIAALRHLPGVELVQSGRGFVPSPGSPALAEHREAARAGLRLADRALQAGAHELVVLDEVCTAVAKGLLDEGEVRAVLDRAHPGLCVVLTGRGATAGLVEAADTVTEMRCVRHAFGQGLRAEKGVEL
ncbi:MAG: cob(I)yrinic acid a,c-diamide adenosyltransferase [Myxococcaceae bacterium]